MSGFAGLGYQIVWTQQCALWLGHEAAAVLAVVAAFFAGLALGAFVLGSRVETSPRPARWYVACELAVAAWSTMLAFAMPLFTRAMLAITGAQPSAAWQWTVAFCGTFVLLLPATAAMGATLPSMERAIGAPPAARSIAPLYAANTFGAVAGVLVSAFWLVPAFGLVRTAAVYVTLNVLCAAAARAILPTRAAVPAARGARDAVVARGTLATLALTGLLGIGYEVVVVRVLSQVAEDTVYTFAMLLAVYLVGTAAGAAGYTRWLASRADARLGDRLLGALAAACLLGLAALWGAERLKALALEAFGPSMTAALGAEAALAVATFGPPTVVMGALFCHLSARANAAGTSFGTALGINTLGAAAAPVVFGVLLFPELGPKAVLLVIAVAYLGLAARRSWRASIVWVPAIAALALAAFAPRLAFIDVPPGGHVVSYADGVMASVSVVEDARGVARLRIDNREQEGSSATQRVDSRQAWLPLLLHSAPHRVLFLGLGTGATASAAASDPTLEVDAVELLPEVIAASRHFTDAPGDASAASRLHVLAADARRYVRTTDKRYDVVVADNFHPARSGSGSLYTVEHFAAVRARLSAGGVFCQWLPLHQLDLATLRSIVRSFQVVFPRGWAMLANNSLDTPTIGLVARADDGLLDLSALRSRLRDAEPQEAPRAVGIEDDLAVLGGFVAGPEALRRFADDAPLNTDDRPIVAYSAPRITYVPNSEPRDRLIALLHEVAIQPTELLAPTSDSAWVSRLGAYWTARDRFIESGRDVRPSSDVRRMLEQVREPLLSVLRVSPDFRPAYDPLLLMAEALAGTDAAGARALLARLAEVQPARPEAARALREIDAAAN